ncbi:hypothetical protein DK37_07550 [Halomonas sp. SUBG004]|nr:hypothetical protein DK37_07550 [Halomonas sp. SUBG004]
MANRVGLEADHSGVGDGIAFWGGSFICGPQGELLAHAGEETEQLVVSLDMARSEKHPTYLALPARPPGSTPMAT